MLPSFEAILTLELVRVRIGIMLSGTAFLCYTRAGLYALCFICVRCTCTLLPALFYSILQSVSTFKTPNEMYVIIAVSRYTELSPKK